MYFSRKWSSQVDVAPGIVCCGAVLLSPDGVVVGVDMLCGRRCSGLILSTMSSVSRARSQPVGRASERQLPIRPTGSLGKNDSPMTTTSEHIRGLQTATCKRARRALSAPHARIGHIANSCAKSQSISLPACPEPRNEGTTRPRCCTARRRRACDWASSIPGRSDVADLRGACCLVIWADGLMIPQTVSDSHCPRIRVTDGLQP